MTNDDLRKTYNRIAEDYLEDHVKDDWDDDYIEYFSEALPKKSKVLDLGCGPGVDSGKLIKNGLLIEGFDLSDKLLEIAKRLNPSSEFTQGDMRNLPYKDDGFDGVFAKASLLHIPREDIPKVLDEIWRVLKRGGIVHIAIKIGDGESVLKEDDYGYEYSRFFAYWNMDDFMAELKKHKFEIIKNDTYQKDGVNRTKWIKVLAKKN